MYLCLLVMVSHSAWSVKSMFSPHPFIRVVADGAPETAALDNLFLCPSMVKDEVDMSNWPMQEVAINGTLCMNHEEILAMETRSKFLECMTEVVNTTTHVLHDLSIDASLSDGSLLGWYRHSKTFIPWDVDADMTLLKEECRDAFEKHGGPEQKNMAELIQSRLPGQGYRATAVKAGVGSEIKHDTWERCETDELRVVHRVGKVACHVDLFFLYRSNDPTAPCKCRGNSDGSRLCGKFGKLCANYEDLYPTRWDVQDHADCKVPRKPVVSLQLKYGRPGMPGINFTNMKKVPMNYKFGGAWMVVIGTGAVTGQLIPPRNASERTSESNFRGSDRSSAADTTTESPAPTPGESDDPMEEQYSDEVVSVQDQTLATPDVEAILQGIVGTTVQALRQPAEKHLRATAEEVAQHLAEQIVAKMGGQNLTSSPSPEDDLIAIPEMEVKETPKEAGIKPFARKSASSHPYQESDGIAEEVAAESDDAAGDYWAPDHSEDSVYSNYAANAMEHDQVKDHLMSLSYWITSLTLVSIACMFTMYSIRVIYRRALSSNLR